MEMINKYREAQKQIPGLVITRKPGKELEDSIYIGDNLKLVVIRIKSNQVRLKFVTLNNVYTRIERAEGRIGNNAPK